MGRVSFQSEDIPVSRNKPGSSQRNPGNNGEEITFSAATIGNPHCIVLNQNISAQEAGPYWTFARNTLELSKPYKCSIFGGPEPKTIRIEIWERGAGSTLASGSSSSAAAAVAYRLGLCDAKLRF
jgi:diaminopimelate epimerase